MIVHGYMEENELRSIGGGTRLEVKIEKVEIFLVYNLTRSKFFNSKSDAFHYFQSKNWRVVKLSNQKLTRCKKFHLKSDSLWNFCSEIRFLKIFFASESFFSKMHKNCNIRPFYGVNSVKTRTFECTFLSKIWIFERNRNKKWHSVKNLFWNLTCLKNFVLKSEAL